MAASVTKNESQLTSWRTLSSSSQLVIRVFVDYTSPIPVLTVGGEDSVSISARVASAGVDSVLELKNVVEDAN